MGLDSFERAKAVVLGVWWYLFHNGKDAGQWEKPFPIMYQMGGEM